MVHSVYFRSLIVRLPGIPTLVHLPQPDSTSPALANSMQPTSSRRWKARSARVGHGHFAASTVDLFSYWAEHGHDVEIRACSGDRQLEVYLGTPLQSFRSFRLCSFAPGLRLCSCVQRLHETNRGPQTTATALMCAARGRWTRTTTIHI